MVRPTLPTPGPDDEWGQQVNDAFEYAFDTAEDALATKLTDASGQTTRWRGIYAAEAELPTGVLGDFALTLEP